MNKITPTIKKLIKDNPMALATVDTHGKPNVIAVAYVKVINDNQLVITDNYMIQTRKNILANKNVCMACWDKEWSGYKFVGQAQYHTKGEWKELVEEMLENKDLAVKGAILVTITEIIRLK